MDYVNSAYRRGACGWCNRSADELHLNLICLDCWSLPWIRSHQKDVLFEAACNQQVAIENARNWRKDHPPKLKVSHPRLKLSPEERLQRRRIYQIRSQEKARLKRDGAPRKYDPDKRARIKQARQDRLKTVAVNDLTREQWHSILKAYSYCCAYCGIKLTDRPTQDHIIPITKGGNHTFSNVIPACRSCNSAKHDRDVDYFFENILERLRQDDIYYRGVLKLA